MAAFKGNVIGLFAEISGAACVHGNGSLLLCMHFLLCGKRNRLEAELILEEKGGRYGFGRRSRGRLGSGRS